MKKIYIAVYTVCDLGETDEFCYENEEKAEERAELLNDESSSKHRDWHVHELELIT